MKKLLLILAFASLASTASAGMRCTTDYWGNVKCTGTGQDSGYSTNTTKDYWGNETTTDNRGNRMTCRKDYWGNTTCD